jgi:fibrillarin-like pre-rRNA processing protein
MKAKTFHENIFTLQQGKKRFLATRNLSPGFEVYGERLVQVEQAEYRIWEPKRSKLAAMLLKKLPSPFTTTSKVLYLGSATGTTVSHVSDIVHQGVVYAVEFSPRTMRDMLPICEERPNIIPLLADASKPQSYANVVEPVDVIFQDVAQPDQASIALSNVQHFLKPGGYLLMSIKARSVDSTAKPDTVFKQQLKTLLEQDNSKLELVKKQKLAPFHIDHLGVVVKKTE